jgi:hypothetical protein
MKTKNYLFISAVIFVVFALLFSGLYYFYTVSETQANKQNISLTIADLKQLQVQQATDSFLKKSNQKDTFSLKNFVNNQKVEKEQKTAESENTKSENNKTTEEFKQSQKNEQQNNLRQEDFKTFTPLQFQQLGDNFNYPNSTPISLRPFIRNDRLADIRIQQLAEARGYKLRSEANCKCLASEVMQGFNSMNTSIFRETGNELILVSGFRSVQDQRNIFLNTITSFSNQAIAEGRADNAINEILTTRSIPGYSKHHTGYTVDFGCNDSNLLNFKNTPCYRWLSDNNYFNAKKFGFIPSYPNGVENQGPDPEEWEYIYVGVNNLLK